MDKTRLVLKILGGLMAGGAAGYSAAQKQKTDAAKMRQDWALKQLESTPESVRAYRISQGLPLMPAEGEKPLAVPFDKLVEYRRADPVMPQRRPPTSLEELKAAAEAVAKAEREGKPVPPGAAAVKKTFEEQKAKPGRVPFVSPVTGQSTGQ